MTESETRVWQQNLNIEEEPDVFSKEGPPPPPHWRPADFCFRLTGVMDPRSVSCGDTGSFMSPRSGSNQKRNTKEQN